MKIRSGFVSNSSSSSFIVKGYMLDSSQYTPTIIMEKFGYLTPEIITKATNDGKYTWQDVEYETFWDFKSEHSNNMSFLEGYEDGVKDGYILIGETLFDSDEAELPSMILSATDSKITQEIKEKLDLQDNELIIACGTRMC